MNKNNKQEKKLCVIVPWPHRYLSPNSRVLWQAKYQVSRKARLTAMTLAKQLYKENGKAKPLDDLINIRLVAHPLTRHKRDEDNIIASMKPYLDGIADAIGVNDAAFHFKELEMSYVKRPPEIEVWLDWQEA